MPEDMIFEDNSPKADYSGGTMAISEANVGPTPTKPAYPPAKLAITEEQEKDLIIWIDSWIVSLQSAQQAKIEEWQQQEKDYRARSDGPQHTPFEGACGDKVPAIAMAVDPIHARLDTGIFKADPVVVIKGIRKSSVKYVDPLQKLVEYYQKHRVKLRQVASPRLLECAKHGTMVFKTYYDRDVTRIKTYDEDWEVVKKEVIRFSGPRTVGVSLNDIFFPPYFQHIQQAPIVMERQRVSYSDLKEAEAAKKLVDCEKVRNQEVNERTTLEEERAVSANHRDPIFKQGLLIEIFELWFKYDIDGDGLPESLCMTYHYPTQTILQLRYNWYFHQRYPYTVIPYTITNDSIYGLGIAEMVKPFQDMLTKWHRMAQDNTYLANIVMFIAKKDAGIEAKPKLFSGKTFFVEDPSKDFKSFRAGENYDSTLQERQNLFGLAEKRTGVSDYLTGRESPIIGSRATATSTLALIQEGTRRVEEVLENIRAGISEIIEMWFYIWFQYGLDGIDDMVFTDDETGGLIKDFFDNVKIEQVNGAFSVDLSATDAANNRSVQQQLQLSIIQLMMGYFEKLLTAGQQALMAINTLPEYTEMVREVMLAAKNMFHDLLTKYDIRNPDEYLPDLERFLTNAQGNSGNGAGAQGGAPPSPGNLGAGGGLPAMATTPPGTPGTMPVSSNGNSGIFDRLAAAGSP